MGSVNWNYVSCAECPLLFFVVVVVGGACFQVDVVNLFGCTPLHVACNNGQDVVVDILLQHKAMVNPLNEKGQTPLHYAAWSHHGALCMELLVKMGADTNVQVGTN